MLSQTSYPEVNREGGRFLGHKRRWQKRGSKCADTRLTDIEDKLFTSDLRLIIEGERKIVIFKTANHKVHSNLNLIHASKSVI